jgi:pimeloyl-ACP methyl ester carboxylesterase
MQNGRPWPLVLLSLLLLPGLAAAQNPAEAPKRVPPPGIEIPATDRKELESGVAALGREIEALRETLKSKPALLGLLPDVQIYHNAVRYALSYHEFFKLQEVESAKKQIFQGLERAAALREGKAPWTTETGLVVRGYRSTIDDSIQPFGLVIPAAYRNDQSTPRRLDVWFHGRGDTLSEVNFIADRQKNPGQFTPPGAIVLHPYGRYCNANKFAGETDLFEALAAVRRAYPIDENRISVRGFSMGGAAVWHIAAHYAGLWAAAAPGAGFAETREYQKLNLADVPWYEQKLWRLYDATDYALNLFNCPVVAYSGEIDRQIQAAQIMARNLKTEGIDLVHIIGPGTEHKYHPDSIPEINRRIDAIAGQGRTAVPRQVKFTTWTLRYHRMSWITIDALHEHWERARIAASLGESPEVRIKTQNIDGFTLEMGSGQCPFDATRKPVVLIDDQKVEAAAPMSDRSWRSSFRKTGDGWRLESAADETGLRKRHGLQGPIDDAFMNRFLMVRPTGKPINEKVGAWVTAEQGRALSEWRSQFRGEPLVKDDVSLTEADIAEANLILWGDPSSNAALAKIADRLPIHWNSQGVRVGDKTYSTEHVPLLIFPNPLNPKRYVVINSGFTFRESHYLTNSQQTPKLPDWAVIDLSTPPSARTPGRIVNAGFFGERWELK